MPDESTMQSTNVGVARMRGPRLNLQDHLADLDAAGLLERIDHPINKDTELHPLVRWQFIGGIPEDERKAFLFTNVVDAKGRRYEMPVVVGALAASPRIYAIGMGCAVEQVGATWIKAIANPLAPVMVSEAPCQEVVIAGDVLSEPGQDSLDYRCLSRRRGSTRRPTSR